MIKMSVMKVFYIFIERVIYISIYTLGIHLSTELHIYNLCSWLYRYYILLKITKLKS